jgi:acyl-CoA thioesterase
VTFHLEVLLPAIGRNVSPGRVVGHLEDQEIITIIGAVGSREQALSGNWLRCPQAPAPENCDALHRQHGQVTMHHNVDIRLAKGMFGFYGEGQASGDGSSLLWARMPKVEHDAGALAIIADYMPSALGNAFGRVVHCTSLDNTIRFANREPTEWVLCENRMEFVNSGFGYGTMHMWSQSGNLLATASQSIIVREPA